MIYVIAGSYQQFRRFRDEHYAYHYAYNYDTLGFQDCRYVASPYDLRGLGPNTQFVVYGTFMERPDIHQIHEEIHHVLSMKPNMINNPSMEVSPIPW